MSDASLADGFRDTEIGSLPVDWQVVRLGHVAKCVCGAASLCLLTLSRGGRARMMVRCKKRKATEACGSAGDRKDVQPGAR